jgi:hypothetical protein
MLLNIKIEPSYAAQHDYGTEGSDCCVFYVLRCGVPSCVSFGGSGLFRSKLCAVINVPRSCCCPLVIRTVRRDGPGYSGLYGGTVRATHEPGPPSGIVVL